MDRRLFLQSMGITAVAGFALNCADSSDLQAPAMEVSKAGLGLSTVGLQLYTLRSIVNNDFESVIRNVAEVGFKEVEMAGYHNLTPEQIRSLLDELNMTAPSTHMGSDAFKNNLEQIIGEGQVLGHDYLICPHPGDLPFKTIDDYKAMADFFNEVGAKVKASGMKFAYHNHEFEFEEIDGQIPMNILMENTDPDLVDIELDLCWATVGGMDPAAYFAEYPGRFPLCHVKDYSLTDEELRNVGAGDVDFAGIFAKADVGGLKHYIVEHDHPGDDPYESIRISFAHATG